MKEIKIQDMLMIAICHILLKELSVSNLRNSTTDYNATVLELSETLKNKIRSVVIQ